MNTYEAKQEARKERYLARAEKYGRLAEARYKAAHDAVAGIPFGQPILVGHHSEGRHRAAIARQDRNMRKMIEAQKAAERCRGYADGVGRGGISSDDPEAVDKLAQRIETLERHHELMKQANACIRRKDDAGLAAMSFTPAQITALRTPDCLGRVGFPYFQIKNSTSTLNRLRTRLAELKRAATRETSEQALAGGIRQVQNAEENRLQLFFPGKPPEHVRGSLHRFGFRWAPTVGAWQRHLSSGAIYAAGEVVKCVQT